MSKSENENLEPEEVTREGTLEGPFYFSLKKRLCDLAQDANVRIELNECGLVFKTIYWTVTGTEENVDTFIENVKEISDDQLQLRRKQKWQVIKTMNRLQ